MPRRTKYRQKGAHQIVFSPQALERLASGFDDLAAAIAVTLGPAQGPILNSREDGSVEVLSDAGDIARRVVEVTDRCRNTGAMILRNLAWRMHEEFGDGAATATVLSRAMVREAIKRIHAGIDPVQIRDGLEHALEVACSELKAQSIPACGQELLVNVATSMTGDPELGAVLGEIVNLLGSGAALTIEEFPIPYLDREYIEGAYWRAHPASRGMIPEGRTEVVLENPLILLADQELNEVEDIRSALELAARSGERRPLLIVAKKIGDRALSIINVNQAQGNLIAVGAVLNSLGPELMVDLDDLALLVGGSVLADDRGMPPRRPRVEDLGSARKAIVRRDSLTIAGGAGGRAAVEERSKKLSELTPNDGDWATNQARLARFNGGIAILKIGARFGFDLANRRTEAEKAFRVLVGMLADGVVSGGGVAYLQCVPAVMASRVNCALPDQAHGADVLAASLEAPFKQIIKNQGIAHPQLALEEARSRGCGFGFDVMTGECVDMRMRGIVDSFKVTQGALQRATSATITLLTTGAVVLPVDSKRERRMKP